MDFQDHPENIDGIELQFSDDELDFNKYQNKYTNQAAALDEISSNATVSIIDAFVHNKIGLDTAMLAATIGVMVTKFQRLIRITHGSDVARSFRENLIKLLQITDNDFER